jgi:biopolymer transport protein ExbB/TolQ
MYAVIGVTVALIVRAALRLHNVDAQLQRLPTAAAVAAHLAWLGKDLGWLVAIAATAPFLGLTGTLVHMMDALAKVDANTDLAALAVPLAQALRYTLLGISAAVPAAFAHAVLARKLDAAAMVAEAEAR